MILGYRQLSHIKQLNLPEIIQSYGIALKHTNNNSYQALCPFHDDTNPSLSVSFKGSKWVWHCFGCRASGTVIDFVMKKENISFIKAYQKLSDQKSEPKEHKTKGWKSGELLERVMSFYHDTFKNDQHGLRYLTSRGITEQSIYLDYKIGYANGSLRKDLPNDGPIIEQLKEIGIFNVKGNEFFYNCVVFPIFDDDGQVVSMYGRSIKGTRHLYLPGPHKGVFNGKVLGTAKKIYLTESIIDCLSLIQMGIKETIPLYGTNGLTDDHIELFKKYQTKEVYLCLDNDDAGGEATIRISKDLEPLGIRYYQVTLPDGVKDINDYLLNGGTKETMTQLIERASNLELRQDNDWPKVTEDSAQITFEFKDRSYRIRGLTATRLDQLKVNVKLMVEDAYHLDTFDLYSAKARDAFTNHAKKILSVDSRMVIEDLTFIVERLEDIQGRMLADRNQKTEDRKQMTDHEREEAMEFLQSEDLIERILADFKECGHVGEESNLLLGYLTTISRKLTTPLAVMVISRSASGKTTLQDAVLSFTPPEDCEKYTRLTDQALFYKKEDALRHKLLAIEEERGASGCSYSLRNLQSSQGLSIAATIKDTTTGKLKTDVYKVQGPTAMMITTTYSEHFDFETYNRFIILTIDESIHQTRRILERQRLNESIEGIIERRRQEMIQRRHHNAQRLLRPLEVANPYSSQLTFIDTVLRARREQPKYLSVMKTVALLRQYQKEIKTTVNDDESIEYIEVDLKDIEIANGIANEILGRNLDELSPPARNLLVEIKRMVESMAMEQGILWEEVIFTRKDVREFTKWSDYQVRVHIRQLEELEYLYSVHGGKGKRYAYQLLWEGQGMDGEKFLMGLIDVEKLKERELVVA